jgi:ABC-type transport system involved in cytochrome c biogenesis permease subunit
MPILILPGLLLRMPRDTFLPGAGATGLLAFFSLLILVIITAAARVSQGQSFIF